MEELVDLLKNVIPAVIVIASLLLPAFIKKKKEDKKKSLGPTTGRTTAAPTRTRDTQTNLEDKVRKYFNKMKTAKKPSAPPSPAQPSRPSVAEPAVLSSREFKPASRTTSQSRPAAEPRTLTTLEKAKPNQASDEAYTVDVDAYKADTDAYALDTDAAAPAFPATGKKAESLTTIGMEGDPLSRIGKTKPAPKPQPAPAADRELGLDAASLSMRDLRRAIILREVLGPPVALKGFVTD